MVTCTLALSSEYREVSQDFSRCQADEVQPVGILPVHLLLQVAFVIFSHYEVLNTPRKF
jgi:hypothetical protein